MRQSDRTAYVYLGLYGDFNPFEVSRLLELVPDECETKHSKNLERLPLPRTSILRYAEISTCKDVPDIYELSDEALKILLPHTEILKLIAKNHCTDVIFQVVLDFTCNDEISTPAIGFSQEVITFISNLNASIDIDTYRT